MRGQGLAVFDRRLEDAEFDNALRAKLGEEAAEAAGARDKAELTDELADLTEVMLALAALHDISPEAVEARRLAKREERGGFDDRVFNAAVEAEDGLPAADYYLARPGQYPRIG
jgi:predicted house-cleaning noncanonical NTP pyrophosphatase (MazG superfamily)